MKGRQTAKRVEQVQVLLENTGEHVEISPEESGLAVARRWLPQEAGRCLAVMVDGRVQDLTLPVGRASRVRFLTWDHPQGRMVFWHSCAHLLASALEELYGVERVKLVTGPAIQDGFYYDVELVGVQLDSSEAHKIEKKMLEIAARNLPFVRKTLTRQEAVDFYSRRRNPYKLEILQEIPDGEVTFYSHGEFTDLCRGPHLPSTAYIKAVAITNIAQVLWKKKHKLTRIYGVAFPSQDLLEEWKRRQQEARQRSHRVLGQRLGLFVFSSRVGAGLPLWLPRGSILRQQLIDFLYREQVRRGYLPVITPHIARKELYEISGHFAKYHHHMFQPFSSPDEEEEYILRPMNCPHHCEIYRSEPRSYRDLPLRLAEFGTVYRYEQSGELNGLLRARCFTVDDSHIFCTPEQVLDEFLGVIDLVLFVFRKLGFEKFTAQVSLRDTRAPDKYVGDASLWERAENDIRRAVALAGVRAVELEGEAAFYGPKLDFMVEDVLGRQWQLGTIQVDYNLPERFDLTYTGSDNREHRPVMIHRAPFGSLERFIGVLIEHTAGNFPFWLAPVQVVVLPVSDRSLDYARQVAATLKGEGFRVWLDERDERISKKIRDAEAQKIPYMLIVGERERSAGTVAVRQHGKGHQGTLTVEQLVERLRAEGQV